MRACRDRILDVNHKLNAVVQLRVEEALADARQADAALANGSTYGPLHGVPFTVNDSFVIHDLVTTAGTIGRAHHLPVRDVTVVRRLREAGGILLGKTNAPELTLSGETDNQIYGRTNNPIDLNRTPGGSSGGAAAIIAAMGSPLDVGTDTGGSIRWPAHCCGIHGFKPTSGRVPRTGHIVSFLGELQPLTQPGPLARSVEDLILATQIIAGEDCIDPHVISKPFVGLDRPNVSNLRVAYYTDNKLVQPVPDIVATVEQTVDMLRDGNAHITNVLPEPVSTAHRLMVEIVLSDLSWVELILAEAGTKDSPLLDSLTSFKENLRARPKPRLVEEWDRYRSAMLQFMCDYDVIICPVAPVTAPRHGGFTMESGSYLTVYNLAGWPAASVRVGTSSDQSPINVQIVGSPWADGLVLNVAKWLVQRTTA